MDIQFLTQDQPLNLLLQHYILSTSPHSKKTQMNSILMKIIELQRQTALQTFFSSCLDIVEAYSEGQYAQKQNNKNMAILVNEVISKCNTILMPASPETMMKIFSYSKEKLFCAVCGNEFISLIYTILSKRETAEIWNTIEECLLDHRMAIGSYRQSTRYHLYYMIMTLLKYKVGADLSKEYIERVLRWVSDEKDPRNIQLVFRIYNWILSNGRREVLQQIKESIFESLQNYYPIDFQGDTEKHHINLNRIVSLLNECLCHPLFQSQLKTLLMVKMGAPPISMYIPTFLIFSRKFPNESKLWQNLLLRTGQAEYLQENYENCENEISDFIIRLLTLLWGSNELIQAEEYCCILEWLQKIIVQEVYHNEENSKHAGTIIAIIKKIMVKCPHNIKSLVKSFLIHKFLTYQKGAGQILYKMGMLVPAFEDENGGNNSQQQSLLVMSLNIIFNEATQDQPRLLVLKLLMLLWRPTKKVINKTQINKKCLEIICNPQTEIRICKAFCDFMVQFYWENDSMMEMIINHNNASIRVYASVALFMKSHKFTDLLISNMIQNHKQFILLIKILKLQTILQIIQILPPHLEFQCMNTLFTIINYKFQNLEESQIQSYLSSILQKANPAIMYVTRSIWRPFLTQPHIQQKIKQILSSIVCEKNQTVAEIIIYYNKAMLAFKYGTNELIETQNVKKISDRMLPITQNDLVIENFQNLWPTLTHYLWINNPSKQLKLKLIQNLPPSLLLHSSTELLSELIHEEKIQTLSKLLSSLPIVSVKQLIVPFCVEWIQNVNPNTPVVKIVEVNKMMEYLLEKSKQQEQLHWILIQNKGKILVGIEEKILQHKKRLARQSGRKVFADYNSLK